MSETAKAPASSAGDSSPENVFRVLLFEDNNADADLVAEYLEMAHFKYELLRVKRLQEGRELLEARGGEVDAILLDLILPDSKGIDTLRAVRELVGNAPIVVLTGSSDERSSVAALKEGAQDYLLKDALEGDTLRRSLRYAFERAKMVKRIEAHARDLEHREVLLRRIFEMNTDAMLIISGSGVIRLVNPATEELLDSDSGQLLGQTFPFIIRDHEESEFEIPGPKNSTRVVELRAVDLTWEGEAAKLVVLRDITQRKLAERQLRAEKERLAVTLDSIGDAVIATDAGGSIEGLNQEAVRLTGWTRKQAIGKKLSEVLRLVDEDTGKTLADPAEALIDRDGKPETKFDHGLCMVDKQGEQRFVSVRMTCIRNPEGGNYGCVTVLRDITHQRRVDEELFKAEKLSSISLLAGGIAHDFNNILTAVIGNISVLRMELGEDSRHMARLAGAEKAALQAKGLTQQLLTFSKGGAPSLESTTIDQLVEESAQFVLRGSNVKCEIRKDEELWAVEVDRGQISQVINNLIINADQAMPDGGIIHLEIRNASVARDEVARLKKGDYVCITVADEGCGISPANMKRIFDPYFTTKETGNGLGLASTYSIVNSHKGAITVDSTVGKGTVFKVFLPRSHKEEKPKPVEPVEENTIHMGTGRILVMDDMESMMMVAGEMLGALGYTVEFSGHGEEAIEKYKEAKERGAPFDAVVFDLTVPGGMGGEEACRILREYDPKLVAIASSGYATSNVMSDFRKAGFQAVVPKPYRIKDMSVALHRILNKDR